MVFYVDKYQYLCTYIYIYMYVNFDKKNLIELNICVLIYTHIEKILLNWKVIYILIYY